MFKLKNKYKIYRRFSIDIWCRLIGKTGITKAGLRCFERRRRRVSLRSLTVSVLRRRRILSIFYGGLSSKDYSTGLGVESFNLFRFKSSVLKWENRVSTVLYRSNFGTTLFETNSLVISGFVCVNREVVKERDFFVSKGDVVELIDSVKETFFFRLLDRLPLVFVLNPLNMEINYLIMSTCLISAKSTKFSILEKSGYMSRHVKKRLLTEHRKKALFHYPSNS